MLLPPARFSNPALQTPPPGRGSTAPPFPKLPRMKPLTIAVLLAALSLAACAARPAGDPAELAADRDRSAAAREGAVARLAERLEDPTAAPAARDQLKSIAWSRREPFTLRRAAINALLESDPADTRTMLALLLPTEPSADVVEFIAETAAERDWTDLAAPLIRAWTRPRPGTAFTDRAEPRAIADLHPGRDLAEIVFDVFITPAPDRAFNDKERRAAWEALGLLDPTGATAAERLADLPPTEDPLVAAVQSAAVELGAVPPTQEQLEWLTLLRSPAFSAAYANARRVIARLSPDQREGLALRHAPALAAAEISNPELLSLDREDLLDLLRERLAARRTSLRSAEGGARDPLAESLPRAEPELAWADLVHILAIDDAVRAPRLVAQLFDHADRDHADTSTEYGGVLVDPDDDPRTTYRTILYPPRPAQRQGDKRFIAAPEMFSQHPDALAHFHFHVQSTRNARYAGPGPADLAYADAFGRANLVLTFIDEDTLAVDYYQPGGATLDLGHITRPAAD